MENHLLGPLCDQDARVAARALQQFDDVELEVPPDCLQEVVAVLRKHRRCGRGILKRIFDVDETLAADTVIDYLDAVQPNSSISRRNIVALAQLCDELFSRSDTLRERVQAAWQAARRKRDDLPQLWEDHSVNTE